MLLLLLILFKTKIYLEFKIVGAFIFCKRTFGPKKIYYYCRLQYLFIILELLNNYYYYYCYY